MPLRPSESNKGRSSEYAARVAGVLGICLASAACDTSSAETPEREPAPFSLSGKYESCRTIIEGDRTEIFCFLKEGARRLTPVSEEQFKRAEAKNGELTEQERNVLHTLGGSLFNIQRIPGMDKECPTVMEKNGENAAVKVYMRFPEAGDKDPRIIFYLHSNGGQNMAKKDTETVVKTTKRMQDEGEPIILILPHDGWGDYYPEGPEKKQPGNWRDFNDADTFANLVAFAEGIIGKRANDITLASCSGGNIGIMKILRSLEKTKDTNPEAADLYERIKQIAYFDSATGVGGDFVGRWMSSDSENSVWNHYNSNGQYNQGNAELLERMVAQGADPRRMHLKRMKYGYNEHGLYGNYFRKFILRKQN